MYFLHMAHFHEYSLAKKVIEMSIHYFENTLNKLS